MTLTHLSYFIIGKLSNVRRYCLDFTYFELEILSALPAKLSVTYLSMSSSHHFFSFHFYSVFFN